MQNMAVEPKIATFLHLFPYKFMAFFQLEKLRYLRHFFSKLDKLILVLQPLFEPDRSVPLAKDINEVLKIMWDPYPNPQKAHAGIQIDICCISWSRDHPLTVAD